MGSPEQLFARFRSRSDPAALAAVFDELAPELLLVAGHVAVADAEDLVQATFLDAIEKRDRWDSTRPLQPWLIGILVNHARVARRDRSRRIEDRGVARREEPSPLEALASAEVQEQLAMAMRSLPRQMRTVVTMRLTHGLTPTEIAHTLGCPLATVKTRLQRGREWLRKAWPSGVALGGVGVLMSGGSLSAVPGEQVSGVWGNEYYPEYNLGIWATAWWDPDGAGPRGQVLVVGGSFEFAGDLVAGSVAAWDPASDAWTAFGPGVVGSVAALAVLPNGDLVIGGTFDMGGGVRNIARWDGAAWLPLGSGLDGTVRALAVTTGGELVAGGNFTTAGALAVSRVASWNGSVWSAIGPGLSSPVWALALRQNGDVVAGGFTTVFPAHGFVQRWDGTGWASMAPAGTGNPWPSRVYCLLTMPNGDLIVGGDQGGPTWNVSRFDGTAWSGIAAGLNEEVRALGLMPSRDLIVGGSFWWSNSGFTRRVARWTGTSWAPLGEGIQCAPPHDGVRTLTVLPDGSVFAGGHFTDSRALRWDGVEWRRLGAGLDGPVRGIAPMSDGSVVVGGTFYGRVARRGSGGWEVVGGGVDHAVSAVVEVPGGDIVAAGRFLSAGGVPVQRIARWDGSAWTPLGAGLDDIATDMALLPDGDLVVGGHFNTAGGVAAHRIARWDGRVWSALGAGPVGFVDRIAVAPSGDVFVTTGRRVEQWNGSAWSTLITFQHDNQMVPAVLPNGDVVVGVLGSSVLSRWGGLIRWDGSTWTTMAATRWAANPNWSGVDAIEVLPHGDLVVGGSFDEIEGVPADNVARWDGVSWSAIGAGVDYAVTDLTWDDSGELLVGGRFVRAGGAASAFFARLATPCSATADPISTTCVGAAGSVTLAADSLPWGGSTFRSTATGFAPSALGVALVGLTSPGVSLTWLWPQTGPGCDQLASQEAIALTLPQGGQSGYAFGIPNDAALAGLVLFHQFLQFELTSHGLGTLSASNGLQLTIGVFQ